MHKLLLMSILLASAIIPAIASRDPNPRRGLWRAVLQALVFNAIWVMAVVFIYPHICW